MFVLSLLVLFPVPRGLLGYRVVHGTAVEGMAPEKSLQRKPRALCRTEPLDGLHRIGGTGGQKPAAGREGRGDMALIKPNEGKENLFHTSFKSSS